jgi:hypothetical protein
MEACSLCHGNENQQVSFACKHQVCLECFDLYDTRLQMRDCPVCKKFSNIVGFRGPHQVQIWVPTRMAPIPIGCDLNELDATGLRRMCFFMGKAPIDQTKIAHMGRVLNRDSLISLSRCGVNPGDSLYLTLRL